MRGDDALELAGDAAGLEAHAVADPERLRRDQHEPGDHVAERLLRRETEDDREDRATDGQRARVEPGDAERREQRDDRGTSRTRKPTVPAVAASIRRNSHGVKRPKSRASRQPRNTITTAAAMRTGVSRP